jgi:hypothetical protein
MSIIYHRLDNPWDKDEPLSLEESDLVKAILKLAEELQHEFYMRDGDDISAQGKTVLNTCYRALRQTVKTYYGNKFDECGLWYDPKPGIPFPKKEGK